MPRAKIKKKEGFQGQKAITIPRKILAKQCANHKIIEALYVTDIGYYPKAGFHYRHRPQGADQHILIYCYEGKGDVKIGEKQYNIGSGEFFVVPKKTAHRYAADETNPWTIFWIHFKGNTADSIVSLILQLYNGPKGLIRSNEKGIQLFKEMYQQLERGYSLEHLVYSNMCLWHFLATFLYNTDDVPKHGEKDPIDLAIDFLSKHTDQVLTLDEIAASVNLSSSHFSYLFKKKTGYTAIEYLNHLKMQKACQYLLFTNLRINEIAFQLGIEDQFYFSRMFTKIMGLSPRLYRERRIS